MFGSNIQLNGNLTARNFKKVATWKSLLKING